MVNSQCVGCGIPSDKESSVERRQDAYGKCLCNDCHRRILGFIGGMLPLVPQRYTPKGLIAIPLADLERCRKALRRLESLRRCLTDEGGVLADILMELSAIANYDYDYNPLILVIEDIIGKQKTKGDQPNA